MGVEAGGLDVEADYRRVELVNPGGKRLEGVDQLVGDGSDL